MATQTEEEFDVESILAGPELVEFTKEDPKLVDKWLVSWSGYSSDHNTWEPRSHLEPLRIFKEYEKRRKAKEEQQKVNNQISQRLESDSSDNESSYVAGEYMDIEQVMIKKKKKKKNKHRRKRYNSMNSSSSNTTVSDQSPIAIVNKSKRKKQRKKRSKIKIRIKKKRKCQGKSKYIIYIPYIYIYRI